MVSNYDTDWLPEVGEEVEIDWGLDVVQGRVKEAYATGSRPRAVVTIESGTLPEDNVTVTVPLDSVRPVGSTSKWSRGAKYEAAVHHAIERVLQGSKVVSHPVDEPRVDMLARLADGRALVVEAKNFEDASSMRSFEQALRRLRNYLAHYHHNDAIGLLVVNQKPPKNWRPSVPANVSVTTWHDGDDDQQLQEALSKLMMTN